MHCGYLFFSVPEPAAHGLSLHRTGTKRACTAVVLVGLVLFSCHPFKSQPERIAEEILETVRAGYPVTDQFSQSRPAHAPLLTDALWRKNAAESPDAYQRYKQDVRLRHDYFPVPVGLRGWRKLNEAFYTDTVRFLDENTLARCDALTYALDVEGHFERWTFVMVEDTGSPERNPWKCGRIRPQPYPQP